MGNKVFSCQHPSSPAIKVKTEGQQKFVSACEVQKAGLRRERKKEKKKSNGCTLSFNLATFKNCLMGVVYLALTFSKIP